MTASSNSLGCATIGEVMPEDLFNGYTGVRNLIYDYAVDLSPEWFDRPFTFFGKSSKQVAALVVYAGPFDLLERYIRNNPKLLLETFTINGIKGTLLQLAIICLDVNILYVMFLNDTIVRITRLCDEGLAEKILRLHKELLPETYEQALQDARIAASMEYELDNKTKAIFSKKMNQLFDAFVADDEKTSDAIENFVGFVKNSKPSVMTDNRRHLILLYVIHMGFSILFGKGIHMGFNIRGRGHELWGSRVATRFLIEVIGAIERELPSRIQQILMCSFHKILFADKKPERKFDPEGAEFLGYHSSNYLRGFDPEGSEFLGCPNWLPNYLLGIDSFYDDIDRRVGDYQAKNVDDVVVLRFFQLITSINISTYQLCQYSLEGPLFDNLVIRKNTAEVKAEAKAEVQPSTSCCLVM